MAIMHAGLTHVCVFAYENSSGLCMCIPGSACVYSCSAEIFNSKDFQGWLINVTMKCRAKQAQSNYYLKYNPAHTAIYKAAIDTPAKKDYLPVAVAFDSPNTDHHVSIIGMVMEILAVSGQGSNTSVVLSV